MQDKLMISIIDDNGSKQFSVHRLVQKVALFTGIGIVSVVILYFILAHLLMSELEVILANNTKVRESFQSIYEKNSELERNIDYKTSELMKVSSKINELESIVNIRKHSNGTHNNEDINLDSLSSLQKDMILKIIPNGNPVDEFATQTFPSKGASVYSLAKISPVYATANGIIDSVRVAGNENYGIQIQHSYGFTSNYGHLGKVVVQKGDFVTKGQIIGYSASSANLYYDLRFIDSTLEVAKYTSWDSENFATVALNSAIDWKSLVWALDDIIQLKNYRISYQSEENILTY
ncbi:M23 family metallopeptidase [Helicobacter magdeburgensis]|uniref:M23 family metallopeptidase n=1 Tax=Helicobacter magdeburgensis TaxID=471858 RepID=A0A4U8T0F3_9HELI|nr:M23 family metallopeptidase [Helicobacter magdeburgensis]TLD92849.1 M23 family metallopeptidase [Helicobacter magdeburgensis]